MDIATHKKYNVDQPGEVTQVTEATLSLNPKELQDQTDHLVVQIATQSEQSKQTLEKIYDAEAINYPTDKSFLDEQNDEIYAIESSSLDEDSKQAKLSLASETYNKINNLIQQIENLDDLELKAQKSSEASEQLWEFINEYCEVIPLWFIEGTKDIADILNSNQFIYQAAKNLYMSEAAEDNYAKARYYVLAIDSLTDFVDNYWEFAVPKTRNNLENSAHMLEQERIKSGENLIPVVREAEERFISSILRAVEEDRAKLTFQPQTLSMISARQHLWTIEDYHRMGETGILTADDRVELLAGQIIQMSPQNPPHAAATNRSKDYLNDLLVDRAAVRVQTPITLSSSEPEPDIAVVTIDPLQYSDHHPSSDEIYLLLEVADNTLSDDLSEERKNKQAKARIYAEAKIREYWVLDVKNRRLYVFRNPKGRKYEEKFILNENDTLSLLAFPDICVSLNQLFPLLS